MFHVTGVDSLCHPANFGTICNSPDMESQYFAPSTGRLYRGRIKFFNWKSSFGFVTPPTDCPSVGPAGAGELFFHVNGYSDVVALYDLVGLVTPAPNDQHRPHNRKLIEGLPVVFVLGRNHKGLSAVRWALAEHLDAVENAIKALPVYRLRRTGNLHTGKFRSNNETHAFEPEVIATNDIIATGRNLAYLRTAWYSQEALDTRKGVASAFHLDCLQVNAERNTIGWSPCSEWPATMPADDYLSKFAALLAGCEQPVEERKSA